MSSEDETFEEKPQKIIIQKEGKSDREKELEALLEQSKLNEEDYKSKLELIAQLEFERRRKEEGAGDRPDIDTPEKLQGFIAGKTGKKAEPAGNVPLSPAQLGYEQTKTTEELLEDVKEGKSLSQMSFASVEQELEVLRILEKQGNVEARQIIIELGEKHKEEKSSEEWQFEGGVQAMKKKEKKWRKVR